jgi:hypothetical protein
MLADQPRSSGCGGLVMRRVPAGESGPEFGEQDLPDPFDLAALGVGQVVEAGLHGGRDSRAAGSRRARHS